MDRKMNVFWALVTLLVVLAALLLCIIGSAEGVIYARPNGNPQNAVTGFFNALKAGDYETASGFVENYSSLGLENTPESEEGQLLFSALKRSYDYSLSESISLAGTKASQKILLRYLDLEAVDAAARLITDMEYNTALRQVLSDSDSCCASEFFDVTVTYSGGKWLLTLDQPLLSALQGIHSR